MKTRAVVAAVVTVSDSRTLSDDASGDRLAELLAATGAVIAKREIVIDEEAAIAGVLTNLCTDPSINLVLTTGGTSIAPRDRTPEATRYVIEREVPGIQEALRAASINFNVMAMLNRGVAGILRNTLIINLPGSPAAIDESFPVIRPILGHAVALLVGDQEHTGE